MNSRMVSWSMHSWVVFYIVYRSARTVGVAIGWWWHGDRRAIKIDFLLYIVNGARGMAAVFSTFSKSNACDHHG